MRGNTGKALGKEEASLRLGPGQTSGSWKTPPVAPSKRSSRIEAGHSEVDPQHVLTGDGLLAGCAHHGQGALLLTQAGPAQEVATGKLVHGLLLEVGRKHSFAGGTFGTQDAPRLLW